MLMKLQKSDLILIALSVIGLAVFIGLYSTLYPDAGIRMSMDRETVIEQATPFVESLDYDVTGFSRSVSFNYNSDQLAYLNKAFKTDANDIIRDSLSVYYWSVRWSNDDNIRVSLGSESEEEIQEHVDRIFGDVRLRLDVNGRPIYFQFRPEQDESAPPTQSDILTPGENRAIAEKLATRLVTEYGGDWQFDNEEEAPSPHGPVQKYVWRMQSTVAGERISLRISVQNGKIISFEKIAKIPKPYSDENGRVEWEGAVVLVVFLIIFILVIVFFIQRLRNDLMDLKSGLLATVLVFIGYFIYFWAQSASDSGDPAWAMLLGFVITAPFVAGGMWALSSVGESLARETWADKLSVLDALRRKVFFPALGVSLLRGLALMSIGLGLITLLNYIGVQFLGGYFSLGDTSQSFWSFMMPSLHGISRGLFTALYIAVTFGLFLTTVMRRRFNKSVWVILILVVLWAFVSIPIPRLLPYALRMSVNGLVGLLVILFFIKYDYSTIIFGVVGMPIFYYGVAALYVGGGHFGFHGAILIGIFVLALIAAFIALRSEPPSAEVATYVPAYLQRIYERERIHRELEIARNVQLSFLPRRNPEINGMDIATLCLPAKEVGGDYYDFVEMGPKKLGVVIGDVSGKGISAAFYMTLTKGFLKSQAQNISSPRQILINMNELFYENSERGFFISMIYGVFDLEQQTLTFARAGHNPMILRRPGQGETEELSPPGIALGLERGEVFSHSIEERTVGIQKNDVFFFYTDGLNEAQNRFHEEFGEAALIDIVERYDGASASDLLEKTQMAIQRFTIDAPQHDDMTAVIVRLI